MNRGGSLTAGLRKKRIGRATIAARPIPPLILLSQHVLAVAGTLLAPAANPCEVVTGPAGR
jgi:hypothetical protein